MLLHMFPPLFDGFRVTFVKLKVGAAEVDKEGGIFLLEVDGILKYPKMIK